MEAAGSPYAITARALTEWHQQGKQPGAAPKKSGPPPDKKVQVLVDTVKSFAKVSQLEGDSQTPAELASRFERRPRAPTWSARPSP